MQQILTPRNIIWIVALMVTALLTWQTYLQDNEISVASPVQAVARTQSRGDTAKAANTDAKPIAGGFELVERVKETKPYFNLFAVSARKIENPGIDIEEAPTPAAPALPFKYLGAVTEENQIKVILEHQGEVLAVKIGDSLGVNYKLVSINKVANNTEFLFLYLPMSITQTMVVRDVPEH